MLKLFRVKLIESLRPEPTLYEVSDSKVPGLIARVQPSGRIAYYTILGRGRRGQWTITRRWHLPIANGDQVRGKLLDIVQQFRLRDRFPYFHPYQRRSLLHRESIRHWCRRRRL